MTVVGIRPDFIRMSEIIRLLDATDAIQHVLIHTGQHYTYSMDRVFFEELSLREPDANLEVGSGTHAEQTARLLVATERAIGRYKPNACLFLGDSNASLAALAAAKLNVGVAHIEAGMRSFDRRMPEEKNRVIVDHLSDYLFAYTPRYRDHLLLEGIAWDRAYVVGNPIVDIVEKYRAKAAESQILRQLGLAVGGFALVTLHRQENVDDPAVLRQLLIGLQEIAERTSLRIYYPTSYRTAKRIRDFGIEVPASILQSEPLGFVDFLRCEMAAALIVTDSGTVQEEASILQVPCVVPRLSTERPETVEVGGCIVSGADPVHMLDAALAVLGRERTWRHILGDGRTSMRIVEHLVRLAPEIERAEFSPSITDPRKRESFSPYVV